MNKTALKKILLAENIERSTLTFNYFLGAERGRQQSEHQGMHYFSQERCLRRH